MIDPSNIFRSERLVYRAAEDNEEDLEFLHALYSDPEVATHITNKLPHPFSKKAAKEFLDDLVARKETMIGLIVCLKAEEAERISAEPITDPPSSDKKDEEEEEKSENPKSSSLSKKKKKKQPKLIPIGALSLGQMGAERVQHRDTVLGIEFAAPFRRRGYGSEALRWVADYNFRVIGNHRLTLYVFGYNDGAVRLYERIGFVCEGRERETLWFCGRWYDSLIYSLLDREYEVLRLKWDADLAERPKE